MKNRIPVHIIVVPITIIIRTKFMFLSSYAQTHCKSSAAAKARLFYTSYNLPASPMLSARRVHLYRVDWVVR